MIKRFIFRHPLACYFSLTFFLFWIFIALGYIRRFHFWVPIIGTFAPAVSALVVTGFNEGEAGVRALVGRLAIWRVGFRWFVIVLGLPLMEALLAVAIAYPMGAYKGINTVILPAVLPSLCVVFIFAAGEELGWRGFALPRLMEGRNAVLASIILGTIHEIWHWPLILLPHQYMSDIPVVPHTIAVVAEAIAITWIFQRTRGSVLLVLIFHGMSNAVGIIYDGIEPERMYLLRPAVAVLVSLILVTATGWNLGRRVESASAASTS